MPEVLWQIRSYLPEVLRQITSSQLDNKYLMKESPMLDSFSIDIIEIWRVTGVGDSNLYIFITYPKHNLNLSSVIIGETICMTHARLLTIYVKTFMMWWWW